MSRKVRVAVIGTGHLGSIHARIYARMPDVELVGIVDTDPVVANNVAIECGCEIVAPGTLSPHLTGARSAPGGISDFDKCKTRPNPENPDS